MKILVGGFHQESNSFSTKISGMAAYTIVRGEELLQANLDANTIISGLISSARKAGAEIVPTARYAARSGGPVEQEVVDAFLKEVLDAYDANAPMDAIFLELHGSTDIVGKQDACGYVVDTIRKHVGNQVVIAFGCDLHANITDKMMYGADGISGYQTYPHTDFASTGRRAAMHGLMKLRNEPFTQARIRVPMIVPAEGYNTDSGVFAALTQEAHELVNSGKILDFSLFQMQPWLDLEDAASTVLVTAKEKETAVHYAQYLAGRLFDLRKEMEIHLYSVDEVIDAAIANETKAPVILVDSADSPNAGSSGDSSFVLSRLLERNENLPACLTICDVAATDHAFEVGVGHEGDFTLGGTYEPLFQKPLKVHAYVKCLHDGDYSIGVAQSGLQRTGRAAVLRIGSIDVVISYRMGNSSFPQVYRAFGVEPTNYRLVMVKSATQYKLHYSSFSTLFYPTDTPGSSTANLASLPFEKLPRPFYPVDQITEFDNTPTFHK